MENKEILEMINQLDKQDFELSSDIKLLYDEIKNIEGSFDISGVEKEIETLKESIGSIELQKGDKGDKGEKGKDGKNGKDGKDGTNGKDGLNGRDGIDGLNGKDGSPDTPEQIIEKINTLENVIEIKTIKDFPKIEGTEDIKRQVDTIGNQVLRLLSKQQQSSGGGTWGSITGTLSNQTDLQSALDLKVPTTRTLTINGTAYDLSADRSWSVGTVTSVAALTLGTSGTDLSSSVATGTTTPVITLNVPTASATNRGALSSTDWTTFNAKESALTFSTGLTRTSNTITSNLSTGISGGQSVIGGTASGNNLTLSSTSNATKGKIIFGTSAYDEVNNRLGVGTISPTASLDVISPSGGVRTGIQLIQATNNVIQPYSYTSIDFTVPTTGLIGQFFATASNYSNPNINLAANSIGLVSYGTNAQLFLAAAGSNGYISFDTGGYGYSNERMRILANGKVGIGTNSPSVGDFGSTFTVKGTGSEVGIITAQRNVSAVANGTGFQTVLNNASSNPVTYSYFNGYIITNTAGAESGGLMFFTRNAGTLGARMTILNDGNTGIGTTTPTALLMLAAGTATASTAPLKFTSGTLNTTAEAGAIEYNNTFHVTNSDAIRRHIVTAPNTTKVTASAPYTNDGYITINIGGTDFKVMTTA